MALGRNHVLVIVAIVGIVALTLIGACMVNGTRGPAYVRINVSDKSAVYLEFERATLRAATSAGGLQTAEPVPLRAVNFQTPQSREFTLPIPADQLPEGIAAVKASFERFGSTVESRLGFCRTDSQSAVWQCDVLVLSEAGDTAAAAKPIQLPNPTKLTLAIRTVPSYRTLGVGVRLMCGDNEVNAVSKDGTPMPVQVTVTDAQGKEVRAKKGPLTDFGFS
jgi:hypothetical protein